MADGASSVDDSDFSRMCTTTGHRKRRDDDSDLGRTRTATGQKKRSVISQTAAHREERLVVERLQRIPYFITSSCYTCTLPYTSFSLLYVFTLSPYISLLCYYSSIKFIYCCMIEVRGKSYALCVCLVYNLIDAIASYPVSFSILAFVWREKGSIFHFLLPTTLLQPLMAAHNTIAAIHLSDHP